MKHLFLTLFVVFLGSPLLSQTEREAKAFDSAFYYIATQVSSTNPTKALHLADSLSIYSVTDKQRLKALMLKADIFEKQERRGEAIKLALKSLEIAKQEDDFSFQARIYGFLSTQYRTIGFLDKGKESIKNGLTVSLKIKDRNQVTKYRALVDIGMWAFHHRISWRLSIMTMYRFPRPPKKHICT